MADLLISKLFSKTLREIADKLDEGASEIPKEKMEEYLDLLSREKMSKDQAYNFLRISRATFDNYVRNGYIPKGEKIKGFKELVWYKDDLIKFQKNNAK